LAGTLVQPRGKEKSILARGRGVSDKLRFRETGTIGGLGTMRKGASRHAEERGIETKEWTYGPTNFGGETLFDPAYRETLRLLKRGIEKV
jgi:hypothetical protein